MIISSTTNFYPLIFISLAIILSLVFYVNRREIWIELEKIEEKSKKYRENRVKKLKVEEYEEFKKRHVDYGGVYYPNKNEIYLPKYFPNPVEGYESKVFRILKERFPEEYREMQNILLKIIKNPEMPDKEMYELKTRLYEIETNILEKFKHSYKYYNLQLNKENNPLYQVKELFSSLFYRVFKGPMREKSVKEEFKEIERFVDNRHYILDRISAHVFVEYHETAHAILHNLIKELYYTIPSSLDEGFADAFAVYHLLDRIERGYITPLSLYQLASYIESTIKDRNPNNLKYAIGDLIFGLDEIMTAMFKLHFSDLSMEELRKEVSHLRRKLGSNIEYIIGIIKNPNIPPEKKNEIFSKLEEKAIMKLKEIL
jgi:Mg2+ and Co2+ transporter CorA